MKFKNQIIIAVTCAVVLLGIFLTVSFIGSNNDTASKDKGQVTTDKQKETDKTKDDEKAEDKQTDDKKTEDKQTNNDQQSQKDEVKKGEYVVKKGDTIFSIARAYMPSHNHEEVIAMIKKENSLKDDTIVEKQKLIIPYEVSLESKSTSTSVDKAKDTDKDTAQNTKTGKKYVVQAGDSLWKIASEQMPKVAQLEAVGKIKAHNNITNENAIKAGDTLYIPEQ